jgi:hypothetical protein
VHEEALTVRGQADPSGAADEERHADLGLQSSNVAAQRLLRHVQAVCGSGEVQLLGDCDEGAEEAEVQFRPHLCTLRALTHARRESKQLNSVN